MFRASLEAALAQPVEHRIRNAGVACSSHAGGTIPPDITEAADSRDFQAP
jgi:hypothetical protein